jgi:hypothetical protein
LGGSCSTHGKCEKFIQNFGRKPEGRGHLENLGIGGRIILDWILNRFGGGMYLVQDRDQWRAVMNTVMKLRIA